MGYSFTAKETPRFLHVRVSGDNSAENVRRYLSETYEAASRTHLHFVLIEEDLEGPPLDPVEVYHVATDASTQTSPVIAKIAYIDLRARRSPSNVELAVTVARDRGVNVRAFPTFAQAQEWLAG